MISLFILITVTIRDTFPSSFLLKFSVSVCLKSIRIRLTSETPLFFFPPYFVNSRNNVSFSSICVDSSGIDNNPTVFYHLMPGSTAQTNKYHTFYLQQRAEQSVTWADIKVNHPLDYESIKEYNLTIRVEVSGSYETICDYSWLKKIARWVESCVKINRNLVSAIESAIVRYVLELVPTRENIHT